MSYLMLVVHRLISYSATGVAVVDVIIWLFVWLVFQTPRIYRFLFA